MKLSVSCYLRYDSLVGSASAYYPVGSGFESRLRSIRFDKKENIRVFSWRLENHDLLFSAHINGGGKS